HELSSELGHRLAAEELVKRRIGAHERQPVLLAGPCPCLEGGAIALDDAMRSGEKQCPAAARADLAKKGEQRDAEHRPRRPVEPGVHVPPVAEGPRSL